MDKFNKQYILEGTESNLLKSNQAFEQAITIMHERLFIAEENILSDVTDIREMGAKLKHNAMMRKTISDFVRELDDLILIGENAKFDEEVTII